MSLWDKLTFWDNDDKPKQVSTKVLTRTGAEKPAPTPTPTRGRGSAGSSAGVKYTPSSGKSRIEPINMFGGNPDDLLSRLFNKIAGAEKIEPLHPEIKATNAPAPFVAPAATPAPAAATPAPVPAAASPLASLDANTATPAASPPAGPSVNRSDYALPPGESTTPPPKKFNLGGEDSKENDVVSNFLNWFTGRNHPPVEMNLGVPTNRPPGEGPGNERPKLAVTKPLINKTDWEGNAEALKGLDLSKAQNLQTFEREGAAPRDQNRVKGAAPMTWEAYNALTDQQRQAVDFNTLLVKAREADVNFSPNMTLEQNAEYDAKVERIFGKEGKSKQIAPRTVELLDKIGLEAKGQRLDDFLSLDRAVTMEELNNFSLEAGKNKDLPDLAKLDADAVREAGRFIQSTIQSPDTRLGDFRSTLSAALSGQRPDIASIPYGFALPGERGPAGTPEEGGTPEGNKEFVFQKAYDYLQDKNNPDLGNLWQNLRDYKFTQDDVQELWNYFDTRSRLESRSGTTDTTRRNSTEIRQFAGIGG